MQTTEPSPGMILQVTMMIDIPVGSIGRSTYLHCVEFYGYKLLTKWDDPQRYINYPTKLFSVYRGIYYTAKKMGITINHEIRISIKQPVFHGKF